MAVASKTVRCCVVGGGPAGMMLGLLLARAGVSVLVLERHADFLRDFRGDTIHPSTLELMHELGILEEFLRLPHQEVTRLAAQFGDFPVTIADFTHLATRCKFIAMMPQWDFLDFLVRRAKIFPTFQLEMRAEATELIEDAGRVAGVRAITPAGPLEVRADLVVAADGRSSVLRDRAGLSVEDLGAPMDVFWFRLSRRPADPAATVGRFDIGRIFVLINRGEHWQCGYVIPKGSAEDVRRRGLEAFRAEVAHLAPWASDRLGEIRDWDDVKLLTVKVDRLRQWYRPGLLCIATTRTPCRRSAASASTWPSRMRWPPRTCSGSRCARAGRRSPSSAACRRAGSGRPASRSGCGSWCSGGSSPGRCRAARPGSPRRGRSRCSRATRCSSVCPPASSASASAPSTSTPRLPRQRSPVALYSISLTTPVPSYWTTRIWR